MSSRIPTLLRDPRDDSLERYGLELVDEPLAEAPEWVRRRAADPRPLAPLSAVDSTLIVGAGVFLLAYLAGIGTGLRWLLRWLLGA